MSAPVQAKAKSAIFSPDSRRNIKILVEKDNKVNQLVLKQMLGGIGLECEVVEDGKKALEACLSEEQGVIFMDCHMPELDGFEATKEIRKMENKLGRSSFIVALTASALNHERQHCLNVGMDEFLTKPLKSLDLKKIISSWNTYLSKHIDSNKSNASNVHINSNTSSSNCNSSCSSINCSSSSSSCSGISSINSISTSCNISISNNSNSSSSSYSSYRSIHNSNTTTSDGNSNTNDN